MHFITFVVTKEKPTEAVLAAAMAPFGPDALGADHKWGSYQLGGRYTGLLIPRELSGTAKGKSDKGPGNRGPGVDVLQLRNLKHPYFDDGAFPRAIVAHDQWYAPNSEILGSKHLLEEMGFPDVAEAFDETEELHAYRAWQCEAIDILKKVASDRDDWLSVLDIHRHVNFTAKLYPEIVKLHPNFALFENEDGSGLINMDKMPDGPSKGSLKSLKSRLLGKLN
jgi:hypothetical protein